MDRKSPNLKKKTKKFRIVVDSAFAQLSFFPKLSKKAKLFHCVYDFSLSRQAEDKDIYQRANENNCFVLTVNFKDFKKLVKPHGPGVLGVESQLTTAQMDEKVSQFITRKDPENYIGKAIKIP